MTIKQIEFFLPYLLSALSIVATVFMAIYTSQKNFKNQINEEIFNQQKKLYTSFLSLLFKIQEKPCLQFDDTILEELKKTRPSFIIFANKECQKHFEVVLYEIQKVHDEYKKEMCNEIVMEEDSIRIESDEYAVYDIQAEDEHYKNEHKIPNSEVQEIITKTIKSIRKSLGIK